jgi:hypothetical protein
MKAKEWRIAAVTAVCVMVALCVDHACNPARPSPAPAPSSKGISGMTTDELRSASDRAERERLQFESANSPAQSRPEKPDVAANLWCEQIDRQLKAEGVDGTTVVDGFDAAGRVTDVCFCPNQRDCDCGAIMTRIAGGARSGLAFLADSFTVKVIWDGGRGAPAPDVELARQSFAR